MAKKKFKFVTLYVSAGVIPMILVALVISIFSVNTFDKKLAESEANRLQAAAYGLAEYFAYDVRESGTVDYDEYSDHSYVNSLLDQGIDQTLFMGSTRFMTSLKNADGSYYENTSADQAIWNTVKSGKDYTAQNIVINGEECVVYYTPVYADAAKTEVWGMAYAGASMDDLNSTMNSFRNKVFLIVAALCIVISALLVLLGRAFTQTFKDIVRNADLLAEGDLSKQEYIDSMCIEYNAANNALDGLQTHLSETIGSIRDTSGSLTDAVKTVDKLSGESAGGADQASQLVGEMAKTAQSMAENVQDANSAVIDMGKSIETISNSTAKVNSRANEMNTVNSEAIKSIDNVIDSNRRSVDAVIEISEQTAECNEAVNQIKSAADVITNIASQTNLLALNASIEAARAGEAGRGFAVVAENIRELAEQSNASAQDIRKSVQDVVSKVQSCADKATDARTLMVEQQELVKQVSENMGQLKTSVADVVNDISSVTREVSELNQTKETILSNISDLSAISEENAANAQEVSATIDSIAAGISGTAKESGKMREMADSLGEQMKYFK